jgi:hypothetical protein
MFVRTPRKNRAFTPEQGGTGMQRLPEQGGTGATRMPEQGGTGISRILGAMVLMAALPMAAVEAHEGVWRMSGEIEGSAQISMIGKSRMELTFIAPDTNNEMRLYAAGGTVKGDYARLLVYRIDMATEALSAAGTLDLFLGDCSTDAELRLKSEADGSGGKSEADGSGGKSEADGSGDKGQVTRVFTLAQPTPRCLLKSEADGSGSP